MRRANIILIFLVIYSSCFAQQSVFTVMQGPEKLGDQAFEEGEYMDAIDHYNRVISRSPTKAAVHSKLARSYYNIKDHENSIAAYDMVVRQGGSLDQGDLLRYAEGQSALKNYPVAITYYKKYLERDKGNELVSKKVWALNNIMFLLEDSSHYEVRPVSEINTKASDLGATLFGNGIIFTSNRKGTRPVDMASDDPNGRFYELYFAEWITDSVTNKRKLSQKPTRFAKSMGLSYNAGPVALYSNKTKMVFVTSASKPGEDGSRTLGLYFAAMENDRWNVTGPWAHNSEIYSITDITINEDGTRMYFSSNMKGGAGGKDIYTSVLSNGSWSKPVNLGDVINTSGDEAFPYLHRNGTLYFSSSGLAGMGGLDIFQCVIKPGGFSEPENIGYPINSHGDDFGLSFDSLATRGYFTSNRLNGGLDDDIYEFGMDLQTYPFQMNGILLSKEHQWSDTLDIEKWPNVKLGLIDTWQDVQVQETTSGPDGSFTFTIPYFSRYHILITDGSGNRHKASLELEKYRTETNKYEIVVIKDLFAEIKESER
jgi:hypothetical protein